MKRIMSSVLIVALILSALYLVSCNNNSNDQGGSSEPKVELNIIDDNYRNWYEIFVYSFYDTNNDGIGDLNGVTAKLDYII